MNPISPSGSASRRAALLLHAMAPADQAWLLASLPPSRRERLQALLRELRDLGIPADAPLLQDLAEREAPVAPVSAVQRLRRLSREEVGWLAERLREEPPQLAAILLAQHAWPWRDALLERLDPERRQQVATGASTRSLSLAGAALCEAVARMLPAASATPPIPAVKRLWARLRLRTRGWAAQ